MYSFLISLFILIIGFLFYSRFIERFADIDSKRITPAYSMKDGVDYVPLPWGKIFLIQFLNIAGLGPIFGAVAGAMWGPVAFIWIVFGSVFAGAVHDFFSGMLSLKHKGLSITEIVGVYLGNNIKQFMRIFTIVLMILVGTVFILGPAKILSELTSNTTSLTFWVWIILIYYLLATLLPIDKIIGRIYPIFGLSLLFMAVGLIIALFINGYKIPEIDIFNIQNLHDKAKDFPIFPMLFITIACGAISGFHATQSPLMARCLTNERFGRNVFYGAMITEGIVALIWAAISMSFFGGVKELNEIMASNSGNAAVIVNQISNSLLGKFGGVLAILGIVAAPISSGDTAFRSARLIIGDFLKVTQKNLKHRIIISIPLFIIGYFLTRIDFSIIWRYFAWSNQTLATIVLWTITIYLVQKKLSYWITLIPAVFMTMVTTVYILLAPEGLSIARSISYVLGSILTLLILILFFKYRKRYSFK